MERKIGINGFGRIGRAVFRLLLKKKNFDVAVINDINPDNKNIAYQLKYDSLYGTLDEEITSDESGLIVDGKRITLCHKKNIDEVPWEKHGVTRVVDASGIYENIIKARNLYGKNIRQIIITHSPHERVVDKSIIVGINEDNIDINKDFIISTGTSELNAFAPVAKILNDVYGIEHCFLTALSPWLPFQNLLDGPSTSWSTPGHIYANYVLGRASTFSLLPNPTTTITIASEVLKFLKGKFYSFSYKVPTAMVSSSDISIRLNKKATAEDVINLFKEMQKKQKFKIFYNNFDPLVSIDFKGMEYSSIIDHRWTAVNNGNYLKLILWYDGEWGYSSRIIDLIDYLFSKEK